MTNLIEVLISFFILSILLLGLDAVQITGIHRAKASFYFTQAVNQLNEITERLKIAELDDYAKIIKIWNQHNQIALPNGRGKVEGEYPHFNLIIYWGRNNTKECEINKMGESGCLKQSFTLYKGIF